MKVFRLAVLALFAGFVAATGYASGNLNWTDDLPDDASVVKRFASVVVECDLGEGRIKTYEGQFVEFKRGRLVLKYLKHGQDSEDYSTKVIRHKDCTIFTNSYFEAIPALIGVINR